jgi:heterodisulfide reductase subunit C
MADQAMEQQKPVLSEEMLKVIHGRVDQGDKREKYQESLQRCVSNTHCMHVCTTDSADV